MYIYCYIVEDTAFSYATVKRWGTHLKMGKESLEDNDRCGRLTTAKTKENIPYVHRNVMDDSCLTVNQIANTVDISLERVESTTN